MTEYQNQTIPEPAAPERRSPIRITKRLLLSIIAVVLVGALYFFFGGWLTARGQESKTELSAVTVSNQLRQADELVTMSYYYTNMGQFKNSSEFYGVIIPFTTKSFILTYDGIIKAGVDLSAAKIECGEFAVTITLPHAKILSHTIDEESLKVFDEKTSIFNPFTVEDYNGFQRDQKAVMEEKALANGLLSRAEDQAKEAVAQLISPMLDENVKLTVTFSAHAK